MADDEHASVGMARCDFAEGARDSLGVVLVRLAVPRAPVDLRFRQPLPRADVDLAQPGLSLDGEAEARAHDLGRLRGAAQIARVDGVDRLSGEAAPQAAPACARPVSFSGGSAWPWYRSSRFHSVSPWRARRSIVTGCTLAARGSRAPRSRLRRHRLDGRDRPRRREDARRGGRAGRHERPQRRAERGRGAARRRRPRRCRCARGAHPSGRRARPDRLPGEQRRARVPDRLRCGHGRAVGRDVAAERDELRPHDPRSAAGDAGTRRLDRQRLLDGREAALDLDAELHGDEGGGAVALATRRRPLREGRHPLQRGHSGADRDRRLARSRRARRPAGGADREVARRGAGRRRRRHGRSGGSRRRTRSPR